VAQGVGVTGSLWGGRKAGPNRVEATDDIRDIFVFGVKCRGVGGGGWLLCSLLIWSICVETYCWDVKSGVPPVGRPGNDGSGGGKRGRGAASAVNACSPRSKKIARSCFPWLVVNLRRAARKVWWSSAGSNRLVFRGESRRGKRDLRTGPHHQGASRSESPKVRTKVPTARMEIGTRYPGQLGGGSRVPDRGHAVADVPTRARVGGLCASHKFLLGWVYLPREVQIR